MKRSSVTVKVTALLLVSSLFLPLVPHARAEAPPQGQRLLGRLVAPEAGRVVVRREAFQCLEAPGAAPDVSLLVIGAESEQGGETHFHPLGALAFDRTLADEPGQWLAYWVFGPSPASAWRHLRAFFPIPVGAPSTSERELIQLEERLGAIERNPEKAKLMAPSPVVTLANLGRAPMGDGFWGGLQRGLAWANVVNPAQFVYRSYLHRRKDRSERQFQRAYIGLQWLTDMEFDEELDPRWVATTNDLRFHLLKNRSFFGRFMTHAEGMDLVHDYESDVRRQLGKTSSWLQSAANEHHLRYQAVYRYSENGAGFPMGGVLYYDPRLATHPDPGWWSVANPFDLPYNPHTHAEVQQLAREHPDELIPLAIYSFQTSLALRPIIVVDFFAPGNPRSRESGYQMMVLAKDWLAITTSSLGYERIPYRVISWAANKKGFTYLVNKSSRLGIEEMRLALESDLYFDPETAEALLARADQRVLNPLVKAGTVEERLAHIQFESLQAQEGRELCEQINGVREKMRARLDVSDRLPPQEQQREMASRLDAWHHQVRLEDFVSQPLDDFGSLGSLRQPLEHFREGEPLDAKQLEELLARLYGKLYLQQLLLPEGREVAEVEEALGLTRAAWQRRFTREEEFARRFEQVEREARQRHLEVQRQEEKRRIEALRNFIEASQRELKRAVNSGCGAGAPVPPELEAHLALLAGILRESNGDPKLRRELQQYSQPLRRELQKLEVVLAQCPSSTAEPWRAEAQDSCLELARSLQRELAGPRGAIRRGGD
ncbi:MAG: hypothetical protein ACRD4U_05385 [Candidatus Acidiferrales bacterium]